MHGNACGSSEWQTSRGHVCEHCSWRPATNVARRWWAAACERKSRLATLTEVTNQGSGWETCLAAPSEMAVAVLPKSQPTGAHCPVPSTTPWTLASVLGVTELEQASEITAEKSKRCVALAGRRRVV